MKAKTYAVKRKPGGDVRPGFLLQVFLLAVGLGGAVDAAERQACPAPRNDTPGNGSMRDLIFAEDMNGVLRCLDGGTDVDQANENGHTALHDAACWGKRRFVSLLISRGADVHARDQYGNTAAEWVMSYGGCQRDGEILGLLERKALPDGLKKTRRRAATQAPRP